MWEKWSRPRVFKSWLDDQWIVSHRWGMDTCTDWETAISSANVWARLAHGCGGGLA